MNRTFSTFISFTLLVASVALADAPTPNNQDREFLP